jgi:chromosome partitioning protein
MAMMSSISVSPSPQKIEAMPFAAKAWVVLAYAIATTVAVLVATAIARPRWKGLGITLGLLMVNALAAADQLVVPTQTEPLGVHGMEGMLKTATMIERSRKRPLPARILPTLFDRRTRACTETLDLLREQHPDRTWVQAVPLDTRLRDAAELTHAELSHEVTQSRGFDAYQRALAWLLREAPQPQEQPA